MATNLNSVHLTAAAKKLHDTFKTPAELLEFCCSQLSNVADYEKEKNLPETDRNFFYVVMLMREVVQKWFQEKENPINAIAEGIHELFDFGGEKVFDEIGYRMLEAYVHSLKDGRYETAKHVETTDRINAIISLGAFMPEYSKEYFAVKEAA